MQSWFSSAEVLLNVTGREKQAFHRSESKFDLKNQNISIVNLQTSIIKCTLASFGFFSLYL